MQGMRAGGPALVALVAMALLTLGLGIRTWGIVDEGWRDRSVARRRLVRIDSMATGRHRIPGYSERRALKAPPGFITSFVDVAPLVGVYDLAPGWGLSWTDHDQDGDPDLLVSNHMHYPSALYVNEGGLFFVRSPLPLGKDIGLDDHVGVWADFDGDGLPDLATANGFYRPDRLFRNTHSQGFREVGGLVGVDQGEKGRGRSAVWADLNGDGWTDLLVFNLLSPDVVYLNNANGTLSDATSRSGLRNSLAKEGGVVADLDGDGDLDVYVPTLKSRQRNLLYRNRGDGVFIEASSNSGADLLGASYSAAIGDYDNDGDLDLYVARAEGQSDVLLRNHGDATFEDVTEEAGVSVSGVGVRNAGFADLDNNGHLDLYSTRGGFLDGPNQENVLLLNSGDGTFREVTTVAGVGGPENGNSASLAFADFNSDGYLDIATTNGAGATAISGPHTLLLNRGVESNDGAHWLAVRASRTDGSRAGQGARVEVIGADGQLQTRVSGLIRIMAQDAPGAHFGLGFDPTVREIRVEWPDGRWERVQTVPTNRTVEFVVGKNPHALQSHPLALLGGLPTLDLSGVRQRLGVVCPDISLEDEKAASDELGRRVDAVLAFAMVRDLESSISISERDLDRTWQTWKSRTHLPSRVWVEQIAAGRFTMFDVPQVLPESAARLVSKELQTEEDVLSVAKSARIRAWDRVFKQGSAAEPLFGAEQGTVRGYVEQGWLTPHMAWERYGPLASTLLTAPAGSVVGPIDIREGRDVQPIQRVWPLRRSFRVVKGEGAVQLERDLFQEDLQRKTRAQLLELAIDERARASAVALSQTGAHGNYRGIRFDIPSLAAVARKVGLEKWPEVREALRKAEHEAALDHVIVSLLSSVTISEKEIVAREGSNQGLWTVPERVRGALFFFASTATAEEARRRLVSGADPEAVAESMGIPAVNSRRSRANASNYDVVVMDRALASRFVGPRHAEEILGLSSGDTSRVLSIAQEHYLMAVSEKLPAEIMDPEAARDRARTELEREYRRRLLDYLLGNRGHQSGSPIPAVCGEPTSQ